MDKLKIALEKLNIEYSNETIEKYRIYMDGILEWNEKINLTAITDRDEFLDKHMIDSILAFNFKEYQDSKSVIDVGTGGGFPGVPLAIISPDKNFVLADSLKKRLNVIDKLTEEANIKNTVTVHGRAEDLAKMDDYRENFDVCVSRAVASLPVLLEYCLPFIKKGGHLLAYKGPDAEAEVKSCENALNVLGGKFVRIEEVNLSGFNHNIVVIQKIKNTPKKYPRNAGTPSKKPL